MSQEAKKQSASALAQRKTLGLLLVAGGVILAGAAGSALSPAYRAQLILRGQLQFAETAAEEALTRYCAASPLLEDETLCPPKETASSDEAPAEGEEGGAPATPAELSAG